MSTSLGFYTFISSCFWGISYLRRCAVYQYKSKFLKPFLTPREFSNQTWLQKTVLWTWCWVKEASCTTLHTVGFHLWWSSWRGKPSLMLGEVKIVISSGGGRIQGRRSEQGHEAALWRDRKGLYLDLGGAHWTWVQNNSLSCRLPSYALHAFHHTYGIPQRLFVTNLCFGLRGWCILMQKLSSRRQQCP